VLAASIIRAIAIMLGKGSSCIEGTRRGCGSKFFNWFVRSIRDGGIDLQLVLFCEASFSLCGEANSQNNAYWSTKNPRYIHELLLHD
jgi:hypothetical protein